MLDNLAPHVLWIEMAKARHVFFSANKYLIQEKNFRLINMISTKKKKKNNYNN